MNDNCADERSEEDESAIIIRALRLNTLSKLGHRDCRQFDDLLSDLFPGIKLENFVNVELAQFCREACEELRLQVRL